MSFEVIISPKKAMSFEARLESIDETLKSLLLIQQTAASAMHTFGTPEAAAPAVKATRKPKDTSAVAAVDATRELPGALSVSTATADPLGLVDGNPTGTRYWLIEQHNTVYAQTPGLPDPVIASAVIVSAAQYIQKRDEYAKKSVIPPVAVVPTTTPVAVLATTANVQAASLSAATPSFDEVTKVLKQLGSDTREGLGRTALVALVNKYLPAEATVRNVPALAALGKNAEIHAEATALLNPVVAAEEADIFA